MSLIKSFLKELVITIYPDAVRDAEGKDQPFFRLIAETAEIIGKLDFVELDVEYFKLGFFYSKNYLKKEKKMKEKTKKLTKEKREEKTYSADIVRCHLDMFALMVHLTSNWEVITSSGTSELFVKAIERIKKEFLNEFKNDKFYYYLNKMENTLIEFIRKELRR